MSRKLPDLYERSPSPGCGSKCNRMLLCGHNCEAECQEACPPCQKSCPWSCPHGQCDHPCASLCMPCTEPCPWQCSHWKCNRACGEPCDRDPCSEPCDKALPCGHPCSGFCGEPCPPTCARCNISNIPQYMPGKRYVQLGCGDVIEARQLDRYMEAASRSVNLIILCPVCKSLITNCLRYSTLLNKTRSLLNQARLIASDVNSSLQRRALLNSFENLMAIRNLNVSWQDSISSVRRKQSLPADKYAAIETLHRCVLVSDDIMKWTKNIEDSPHYSDVLEQIQEFRTWLVQRAARFNSHHHREIELEIQRLVLLVQVN